MRASYDLPVSPRPWVLCARLQIKGRVRAGPQKTAFRQAYLPRIKWPSRAEFRHLATRLQTTGIHKYFRAAVFRRTPQRVLRSICRATMRLCGRAVAMRDGPPPMPIALREMINVGGNWRRLNSLAGDSTRLRMS
jgi:hypothetical protein